jgi:hypothetical protein
MVAPIGLMCGLTAYALKGEKSGNAVIRYFMALMNRFNKKFLYGAKL